MDVTLQELSTDPRRYEATKTWIDYYDKSKVSLKTAFTYNNFEPATLHKFFNFRFVFNSCSASF